jgi:DNA polymerase III epsilon subunit-like protein
MPKLVVIDTETTGLGERHPDGPRPDAIVQIGIAWRGSDGEVKVWERTCNPGAEFVKDGRARIALEVNGLTVGQILAASPSEAVARELKEELSRIRGAGGKIDLRAFNCEFDRAFLSKPPWNLRTGWGPCLMIEAAECFGYDTGRVKLGRAAELLKVQIQGRAHSAGTDASTALQVHEAVLKQTKSSGATARPLQRPAPSPSRLPTGYRQGCELCENTGPHDGPHGYFQEGEFYPFD